MFSKKNNCPVPFDQQPLNEYLSLRDSFLFSWSISSKNSFICGFVLLFIFLFIFFSISLLLFSNVSNFSQLFLLDLLFSNIVIFFLFIRLYLGWSYIIKRLMSATVFYEESGWYDGQIWVKTSDYLVQDRLVGAYQVMPFILRIKYSCISVLLNFFIICLFNNMFFIV
uniref:hypothetical protein n=1 Tax=Symphyocladia marchantioides TaxID=88360 RepID=UPI0022FD50A0|nr:hypothetical protein PNW48_pgp081 [Symphyocladia marchantioides]WAX03890.1 hypothetical protein [Symphyocladia marchantioides]